MSDKPHARKRPSLTLNINLPGDASPAPISDGKRRDVDGNTLSSAGAHGDKVPDQKHDQPQPSTNAVLRNVLAVQYKAFPKQPAPFVYLLASIEGETLTIITKDAKSSEIILPPKRIVRGAVRDAEYYAIMESLTSCMFHICALQFPHQSWMS